MRNSFAGLIFAFALFASLTVAVEVCPGGEFYNSTSEACGKCPMGTFAAGEAARTECTPCSAGEYAPVEGLPMCIPCLPGKFEINRVECGLCPNGTSSPEASSSPDACTPCAPGTFSASGSRCLECPAGLYEKERKSCDNCPAGTFSEAGGASGIDGCTPCADGYISSTVGKGFCWECSAGTYASNRTSCEKCPDGSISKDTSMSCEACPAGTVANYLNTECQKEQKKESYWTNPYVLGASAVILAVLLICYCKNNKKAGYDVENGPKVSLIYQNRQ